MIAITIQGLAALLLAARAGRASLRSGSTDRSLVPFVGAAVAAGLLCAWQAFSEVFVAAYSDAHPDPETAPPIGLSLAQHALAESLLVLLPALALVPAIRRTPRAVTLIACLAWVPAGFAWLT